MGFKAVLVPRAPQAHISRVELAQVRRTFISDEVNSLPI